MTTESSSTKYYTIFQDLPGEIHYSISEYLPFPDRKTLSQTSQSLRSVYSIWSFEKCIVPTIRNPVFRTDEYRIITIEAFLNPSKYASWFQYKTVKTIKLEGDETPQLIEAFSRGFELSPMPFYSSLVILDILLPFVTDKVLAHRPRDGSSDPYPSMVETITKKNTAPGKIPYNISILVLGTTFLSGVTVSNNITVLELQLSVQLRHFVNLPALPNLKEFTFRPDGDSTEVTYSSIFSVIALCTSLEKATIAYDYENYTQIKTILMLPKTISYCKLEFQFQYDFPNGFPRGTAPKEYEIPQVTHISMYSRYAIPNSVMAEARFPRLVSFEGNMENKFLIFNLAKNNRTRRYMRKAAGELKTTHNIRCNRFNITSLEIGNFDDTNYPNFSCVLRILTNFTHLKNLSIMVEKGTSEYRYMMRQFSSRPQLLTLFFKLFLDIRDSIGKLGDSPGFKSVISNDNTKEMVERTTQPYITERAKFLCSDLPDNDVKNFLNLDNSGAYNPDEIIPDYKTELPEAYSQIEDVLGPEIVEEINPSILLELILQPETLSSLSYLHPCVLLKYFPDLQKKCADYQFVPFNHKKSKWKNWMSQKSITSSNLVSKAESKKQYWLIAQYFAMFIKQYAEIECLFKIILNDLKFLEHITIDEEYPLLVQSFWLESVARKHKHLKKFSTRFNCDVYENVRELLRAGNLLEMFEMRRDNRVNILGGIVPPVLRDYISVYAEKHKRKLEPVLLLDVNIEMFNNKCQKRD